MTEAASARPVSNLSLDHAPVLGSIALVGLVIWQPGRLWEALGALGLVALCLLATGWPGLVTGRPGLQHQRRQAGFAEIQAIGDSLAQAIPATARDVRQELDQIRNLMSDAVNTLESAFTAMHADTSAPAGAHRRHDVRPVRRP